VAVTVQALRFSVADWSKAIGSTCGDFGQFTLRSCQNDDILLLFPTLSYSGTSSFSYSDSPAYVDLVDNASHIVLTNVKCPGSYGFNSFFDKWPCSNIGYGQGPIEMRPGAKITPGWVSWIMPSKDFAVGPTLEIETQEVDPTSSNGFFHIQVPIEPVPARTSP
jgi:hypothetical protein